MTSASRRLLFGSSSNIPGFRLHPLSDSTRGLPMVAAHGLADDG
jgi:hypothetical protein